MFHNLRAFALIFLSWIFFAIVMAACNPKGPHLDERMVRAKGETTSYDQVRPIFAKNCGGCHPSRSGPDWLDYRQAQNYADNGLLQRRAVDEKSMPPPSSLEAVSITSEERRMIGAWIAAGAPEHAPTAPTPMTPDRSEVISGTVQKCFQCHGPHGPSQAEATIPRLGGQNKMYLELQLMAFKWRRRVDPSNSMNDLALTLSMDQIQEAARFYARQKGMAPDPRPQISDPARYQMGQKLAAQYCVSCHMNPGTSDPSLPKLAGQSEPYLLNQLLYFRAQERSNKLMVEYTRYLSDEDVSALALFFAVQP